MTRYRAVVEYEYPDRVVPADAMQDLRVIASASGGRVVEIRRVDPAWCEACRTYHAGTGEHDQL